MPGIYIHIPFCRQKCYYCDFYKTVNTTHQEQFLDALKAELTLRKNFAGNTEISTVYFGGGTPTVLNIKELEDLIKLIFREFRVSSDAEITLEANPDDLNISYLSGLFDIGINRLSIGIQTFQEELLKKMNRRHDAKQAIDSVEIAVYSGIKNISADLIYGIPGLTDKVWRTDLELLFQLPVTHISAYHLTYHQGTPFYTWLKKGTLKETSESESVTQFESLLQVAENKGFEHYEISNFARDKKYSRHNKSYWFGEPYLGVGPSAHSFDGKKRRWNVSNLETYIKGVEKNGDYFETEILGEKEKFNEYILTRIRTRWGVSSGYIREKFGKKREEYFIRQISRFMKSNMIVQTGDVFVLSPKGMFVSDDIMADLMIV